MFTGIISHLGKVKNKSENTLVVECSVDFMNRLSEGASIAIDGICLTVVEIHESSCEIDFMPETADRTNITYLKAGDLVNVELPATPTTLLSGHIVQGHIDGVAKLESITQDDNSHILTFSHPQSLSKYIVKKGSIAINGISLTVIEANTYTFTVGIIPHTWKKTMLHRLKVGDVVNIEVDILAKYIERLYKNEKE